MKPTIQNVSTTNIRIIDIPLNTLFFMKQNIKTLPKMFLVKLYLTSFHFHTISFTHISVQCWCKGGEGNGVDLPHLPHWMLLMPQAYSEDVNFAQERGEILLPIDNNSTPAGIRIEVGFLAFLNYCNCEVSIQSSFSLIQLRFIFGFFVERNALGNLFISLCTFFLSLFSVFFNGV